MSSHAAPARARPSRFGGILCAGIAIVAPVSSASAVTVTPVQLEMTSVGSSSHAVVTVFNDGATPLPIEAVIAATGASEAKQRQPGNAEDNFLIIPPQALIPPGGTQNFRLQWLGEPLIAKSQNFMLYMNQVPVKPRRDKSSIQVVFSVGVMINVAPPNGRPSLQVVGSSISVDANGQRRPALTVENRSNVHALFSRASVSLSHGSWQATVSAESIGQATGIGLVPPGERRTFVLPVVLPSSIDRFDASIDYASK